jgi:hypothetical protein
MSGSNNPAGAAVDRRPDSGGIIARLRPVLDQLEGMRLDALAKRNRARAVVACTAALGVVAALFLVGSGGDQSIAAILVFALTIGLCLLLHHLILGGAVAGYCQQFKSTAFRQAARLVAPGIDYAPTSMVPRSSFERGDLFSSNIDRYRGEDCFHGKAGNTDILLSELHVERKETSRDSKGHTRTNWVTVFRGIYLIADFHKHFRCHVRIEPDIAEAAFGWFGRKIQGFSDDLIRLENPEFERAFKVCASDPVEARYLLTPDMQERFLELRNQWSPDIRAALIDSSLHLAIPIRENWFEPDIGLPADHSKPLADFVEKLALLLQITEQLDLNTRIWTKE